MIDDHNIFYVFIFDSIGSNCGILHVQLCVSFHCQKEKRAKVVMLDKTSYRANGRPFFLLLSWPTSALVSHNDKWQRLMKQRSYIITSLMRQLTAGGGKREQDRQYRERDG